jgi:hypothetical protein
MKGYRIVNEAEETEADKEIRIPAKEQMKRLIFA